MRFDGGGWLQGAVRRASPFFDRRPAGTAVELVVIHNISLPPGVFGSGDVARLFCGTLQASEHPFYRTLAGARVSAHFFIDRAGAMVQFVSALDRAWHAGASVFEGRRGCNDFSVGIELEGTDFLPFADAQYQALGRLVRALRSAFPVRALRGHSDVAVDRKTDPGPFFEWARLRAEASLDEALLPARRA